MNKILTKIYLIIFLASLAQTVGARTANFQQFGAASQNQNFLTGVVFVLFVAAAILIDVLIYTRQNIKKTAKKRLKRILLSQKEVNIFYNLIKEDCQSASKSLADERSPDVPAAKFFLRRIRENAEKMDKYTAKGISAIGKYDIIKDKI